MNEPVVPHRREFPIITVMALIALSAWGGQYWWEHRVVVPEMPSIVMLPTKVSGVAGMEFLADAIPATLSDEMEAVQGIETWAPPTSTEFTLIENNRRRLVLAYGANVMVTSAVNVDGDNLKIDIVALEAKTEQPLWGDSYQGARGEYVSIMQRMRNDLSKALKHPTDAPGVTGKSDVELAFRQGEFYLDRYDSRHENSDFDAASAALKKALELDPKFANAAADMARLYGMRIAGTAGTSGVDPSLLAELDSWVQRALQIDPKCGRAYYMMSISDTWREAPDPSKKLANALRASAFASDYAPAHFDLGQTLTSSTNLALAATRYSRNLDPLYLYAPLAETGFLHQLGRTSEAFAILDRQVMSIQPNMEYGRVLEASLMIELGWLQKVEPLIRNIQKDVGEQRLRSLSQSTIRERLAIANNEKGSIGVELSRILAIANNPKATPAEIRIALESVPTLAFNHYEEDAFLILEKASALDLILPYDWLRTDHRLDRMRKDRRWFTIADKARIQFEAMLNVIKEAKSRGELPAYLDQPLSDVQSQLSL